MKQYHWAHCNICQQWQRRYRWMIGFTAGFAGLALLLGVALLMGN